MKEILCNSTFFGVMISLLAYETGLWMKRKFKLALFNPLMLSIIIVIVILVLSGVDYQSYNNGAKYISYLLTPATICLAIPLFEQFELLKRNVKAILIGITTGALSGLVSIFLFALLFHLNHIQYVTLLPKSITAVIGMSVSEELGGIVAITVAVIIITGIIGNVFAETVFKICKIEEPVAKGIALGTSSHIVGTVKATELGEIEAAMSSLSIVVAGLITFLGAIGFSYFI